MSPIPRIAVVEQHSLMRRGLEGLLSSNSPGAVGPVAAAPSELPAGHSWDVIVYGPPAHAGPPVSAAIADLARSGRVLVIADFTGWQAVTDTLCSGAFGCVSRRAAEDELLRAVDTVRQGGLYVSPGLASRVHRELQNPAEGPERALAHREQEALRWLAMGMTHSQIARRMGLTETTVSTYIKRIRNKLNVGNKADLTRKAIEMGLVQNPPSPADAASAGRRFGVLPRPVALLQEAWGPGVRCADRWLLAVKGKRMNHTHFAGNVGPDAQAMSARSPPLVLALSYQSPRFLLYESEGIHA